MFQTTDRMIYQLVSRYNLRWVAVFCSRFEGRSMNPAISYHHHYYPTIKLYILLSSYNGYYEYPILWCHPLCPPGAESSTAQKAVQRWRERTSNALRSSTSQISPSKDGKTMAAMAFWCSLVNFGMDIIDIYGDLGIPHFRKPRMKRRWYHLWFEMIWTDSIMVHFCIQSWLAG